jgi:hypothetical protein
VAQDEVGHLDADLVRLGDGRQPRLRGLAVVLKLQHVLEHGIAALGPADAEAVGEGEPVLPA